MGELVGRIVTPGGSLEGRLVFDSFVQAIEPVGGVQSELLILPGFIDLHVHGGGGADCMDGVDAARQMARFHTAHGTTSLLATTMTDRPERIEAAISGVAEAMADPYRDIADILGVHLEGPFISPDALGAQPPFAIPPDPNLAVVWNSIAPIRVATVAPEIDEANHLLQALKPLGTRVQIGHSCASAAQTLAALEDGYAGFTHLFNAMTGMHHRKPGIVGCALAHGNYAEAILDLFHVDPEALRAAIRAIPELYAITDAGSAAGMPDGRYRLGIQEVEKRGDQVVLPGTSTIAGSALTMDRAFANLLKLGLTIEEASRRCSTVQADYLGLEDRGRLMPGERADIVVMNKDYRIEAVYKAGRKIASR